MTPKPKKPFVPSDTYATNAIEDSMLGKIQNYDNIAADQQQLVKDYMKPKQNDPSLPLNMEKNTSAKIAAALSIVNGLIPEDKIDRFSPVLPENTYNPYKYGTGSQAIMETGGHLSSSKAKEMLKDGTAHGKKLTKKQKRYFGMVASGKAQFGLDMPGDPVPIVPSATRSTGKFGDDSQKYAYLSDLVNYNLANGGNPLQNDYGKVFVKQAPALIGQQGSRDLMDSIILFNNNPANRNISGDERVKAFYSQNHSNPNVQNYTKQVKQIGYSPISSYWDSPDVNLKQPVSAPLAGMDYGGYMKPKKKAQFGEEIMGAMGGGGGDMTSMLVGADPLTGLMMQGIKRGASISKGFIDLFSQVNHFKEMDNGGEVSNTVEFSGPSHEDGGIPISYGGKSVEVEGGETAFKDAQNNLQIMGNMKVPGTNKKFKSVSKAIMEKEKEYDKLLDTGSQLVNKADVTNKWDRLKFNAGRIMMDGGDIGKTDLAVKKEHLAAIQSSLLSTAEEFNLDPQALSEGKNKKAKEGTFAKAASGAKVDPGKPTLQQIVNAIAGVESGADYFAANKAKGQTAYGKYQMIESLRKDIWAKNFKDEYPTFKEFDQAFKTVPRLQDEAMGFRAQELNKKYNGDLTKIVLAHRLGEGGVQQYIKDPSILDKPISASNPKSPDKETPRQYLEKVGLKVPRTTSTGGIPTGKPVTSPNAPITHIPSVDVPLTYKDPTPITPQNPAPPPINPLTPPTDKNIPSNVRPLDPLQLLPELFAFGQNKEEPVPVQKYSPDLFDPYQVSFQDRRNQNQSTFNALTRQVNSPTALSSLAGQKYAADSNVTADEFRTNQTIGNQIINQNTGLLNDAQLKNLQLADTQMVRQSQARSNTKQQNQVIANSIASKYLQNRNENQKLSLYENLYDYRFVDTNGDGIDDKATYMGPDAQFNYGTTGASTKETPYARITQELDALNQVKKTRITTPSPKEREKLDADILKKKSETPLFNLPRLFNRGLDRR